MKSSFKYSFIFLSLLLISSHLFAQFESTQGRFTVDFVEGCATLDVIITPTIACPCNIYFNSGSGNPVDDNIALGELTHTVSYADAGVYNLIVVHEGLNRDSIQIVVHENIAPEFTASSCSNLDVDIDITDTSYDEYLIDFGDGSPPMTGVRGGNSYTYLSNGNYSVVVQGIYTEASPNCINNSSSLDIVAVLPDATITSLSLISTDEATMEYTLPANVQYYLEIQPNSDNINGFQRYLIDPLTSSSPLQISDSNLDFDANYYCFRIATFDPCNSSIISYSNTLCSVDLDDVIVNDLSNHLDINASATELKLAGHDVQLFDNTTSNFNSLFSISRVFYDHQGSDIICNTEYCYRIVSTYNQNGNDVTSTSLTRCATALSLTTPTQVMDISIEATTDPIISWSVPIGFITDAYQITTPTSVGSSTSTTYTDNTTDPSLASACYQVGYVDQCGKTANQSDAVCSIFLSHNVSNNINTLRWTSFNGWSAGVMEYQVIRNGAETVYTGTDLFFELSSTQDTQKTTYQIIAIPNDGLLVDSRSNTINITNRTNITFPNAIVPNGINNEFKVVGRYIVNFDLKIYTRWGELIAHIQDQNIGWDGKMNGRILPEGNYIYAAEIEDEVGNLHQRNGTVLLIRN